MHVYEKVRAYIDEKGYKSDVVAEKAEITKETFDLIMSGNRTLYADELRAICIALNVSPEVFIDVKEEAK